MDQGSALVGTGGAPLSLAVPSCRQIILLLSVSSLWLGNKTPHDSTSLSPPFFAFRIALISIPLLCHFLSFAYCLCTTLPCSQPPKPSCLPCQLQAIPSSSWLAPPQSRLSCLGPFVLTVVCQLGLHVKTNQMQSTVRKWRSGKMTGDKRKLGLENPIFVSSFFFWFWHR